MKIKVTMKNPDALEHYVCEAVKDHFKNDIGNVNIDPDELDFMIESKIEDIEEIASTWFKYGEYLTVEFDTDTKTIEVLKAD